MPPDAPSEFMRAALEEARLAVGRVSPNPAVGAVVVRDGRIVGRGHTQPPGQAHAEVMALLEAGDEARGTTVYVTLEPCSHHGRTPPCTDALIAAGVAAVSYSIQDPDERVSGSGVQALRDAGIEVAEGDGASEAIRINEGFLKHRFTGLPIVIAKFAASLDGRIAASSGDARWVSGEEARAWAHEMGWQRDAQEQLVTVFCYQNPALPALLQTLRPQRCALLIAPGPARDQLLTLDLPPGLRQVNLPYLSQADFDRLLACADLNLVRGEDSFVRAQRCATGPFLWQAYPQHDGAQGPKLEAFLDLYLAGQAPPLATSIRAVFRAFNGQGSVPTSLPDRAAWRAVQAAWGRKLQAQTDLCSQLIGFVRQKHA